MVIALNFITLELISEDSGRHWLVLLTSEQLVLCLIIFGNDFFFILVYLTTSIIYQVLVYVWICVGPLLCWSF